MSGHCTHAIIYIGAPYGDDESGHIVSRHKSARTAAKRYAAEYEGTTGVYNHIVVPLHEGGGWDRSEAVGGIGWANVTLDEVT